MSRLNQFFGSSIGKKFVMAITGILLIFFLIVHLINNLMLFGGPEFFNENVMRLDSIKPLIRVVEVVLALIFLYHIYRGIKLWFENKKANPDKYAINGGKENSTLYSRTMFITGILILVFLVIHLYTLWTKFNFGMEGSEDYFAVIKDLFKNPFWSAFYLVIMIFIGFHINHAFQSSFQSFGWSHKKYTPLVKKIGTLLAIVFAIGFASIPIYFYLISLGGQG
ncbi:MAG: succinate dehydrogenase [Ignavibacteriales bacterium CG_4_9_14_3_um_filter_30_11]|nr:MAG: succinate dehydrogenase [Ignavibacteriales bacterium CG_4_9_14_3_um_filter_30_11]